MLCVDEHAASSFVHDIDTFSISDAKRREKQIVTDGCAMLGLCYLPQTH